MKKALLFFLIFYAERTLGQSDFIIIGNAAGLDYSDPQPDITFSAIPIDETSGYGSFSLDIDGDGIPDFGIVTFYFPFGTKTWKGIYISGFPPEDKQVWFVYNDTACSVFDPSQYDLVHPLQQGDTIFINNNSSWAGLSYLGYDDETQSAPCVQGTWTDNASHYIGLRIKKDNIWYYGWIHLSAENITKLITIYDYAIQPEVTGISSMQNQLTIFPNPVHTKFSVTNASAMNYSLYDESGTILLQGTIDHAAQMIDASALPSGVYFLKIYDEKRSMVKRLSKF